MPPHATSERTLILSYLRSLTLRSVLAVASWVVLSQQCTQIGALKPPQTFPTYLAIEALQTRQTLGFVLGTNLWSTPPMLTYATTNYLYFIMLMQMFVRFFQVAVTAGNCGEEKKITIICVFLRLYMLRHITEFHISGISCGASKSQVWGHTLLQNTGSSSTTICYRHVSLTHITCDVLKNLRITICRTFYERFCQGSVF